MSTKRGTKLLNNEREKRREAETKTHLENKNRQSTIYVDCLHSSNKRDKKRHEIETRQHEGDIKNDRTKERL